MKKHWCVCIVFLMISHAVKADTKDPNIPDAIVRAKWEAPIKNANDPNEVLQVKWNAVAKILQSKDIDQVSKEKIIDTIVSPIFDFALMSKLALGKTNWSKLTPSQYETFSQHSIPNPKNQRVVRQCLCCCQWKSICASREPENLIRIITEPLYRRR